MRTLIISDLHIGHPSGQAVLQRPKPVEALLAALEGIDRLVLAGDIVEFRESDASHSMELAQGPLAAVGHALGPDTEVIITPGNHDHRMVRDWVAEQAEHLELEAVVPNDASPLLATITGWLGYGGARVQTRYPGFTLSDRVWVTHGHYLDRLLTPDSPYGVGRRTRGPIARTRPWSYELADRERFRKARSGTSFGPEKLLDPRMSKFISRGLGVQMRRHSIPAFRSVLGGLGVHADYVIYGHVHRHGPFPGEDWGESPRLVNTGSWFFEPLLLNHAGPPDPYWPGGAAIIEDDGIPRPVNLLEELTREELQKPVR